MATCPANEQLQQLLGHRLTEAEQQTLDDHLQACSTCADALARLTEDQEITSWRQSLGSPATPSPEAMDPAFLLLLKKNRPAPAVGAASDDSSATVEDTGDTGTNAPADSGAVAEDYPFLTPSSDPSELGRLGAYRVLKVLGTGGMGIVFLAEDVHLQRSVALKVLKPALAANEAHRQRFLREARAAAKVQHDHVVTIYQVGQERDGSFLAMELLEGVSLEHRLRAQEPLPIAEIVRIGRETTEGLAAAHERGLIHRDIKPANLWLESPKGRVKILDFGLARSASENVHLTDSGAILGTPAYMAPEQARGEPVDARCDLFSLGCVLYRLGTGALPFPGENTLTVLNALATLSPRPVAEVNPAVPPALSELIMQLLSKDAAQRPVSAREVADRLATIERRLADDASRTDILHAPLPQGEGLGLRGNRGRRGMAIVLAVLVLVPLGYYFGGTVIRIATNKGELVIENADPNIQVTVKDKTATIYDKVKERRFVLTPGDYDVEVREEGDGGVRFATKRFTIARGGQETFNARMELAKAEPRPLGSAASEQERKAADWVLSIGGKVSIVVGGKAQEIAAAKDLPAEKFQLVGIVLMSNPKVKDASLEQFKGLFNLKGLNLYGTRIGDAGVVFLEGLTNLEGLNLGDTQISDAGLSHLKSLRRLGSLALTRTRITDVGLDHLKPLGNLQGLSLGGANVTAKGVAALEKALPKCTITWDGNAERQAAEWVLAKGGKVTVDFDGKETPISAAKDLPAGAALVAIDLKNCQQLADADMEHLKALTKVTELRISETAIGDAGLKQVAGLASLTSLWLEGTRVSDVSMTLLARMPRLENLSLWRTAITDQGLAQLSESKTLRFLYVSDTKITDAGLPYLKRMPQLTDVHLNALPITDAGLKHLQGTNLRVLQVTYTPVTDAGLEHIKLLTNLTHLDLTGTKVTAAGVAALKKALPHCQIVTDAAPK